MPEPLGGDSVLLELLQDVEGSDPKLIRLKLKRMASCAFSFFRGSCPRFARDWNDLQPPAPGPELLVCGDLHLENFGAYRDDDGDFLFDLNDFDEAVIAPCAVDPVRCATSVLLAAELWGLSPLVANGLVLAYLDQYQSTVTTPLNAARPAAAPRLSLAGADPGEDTRPDPRRFQPSQSRIARATSRPRYQKRHTAFLLRADRRRVNPTYSRTPAARRGQGGRRGRTVKRRRHARSLSRARRPRPDRRHRQPGSEALPRLDRGRRFR